MADLTVLSPQPLIILSSSNVSGRFSNGASLHTDSGHDMPASSHRPFSHEHDTPMNPSLLSPPRKSFRSKNNSRQQPPPKIVPRPIESSSEAGEEEGSESEEDDSEQTSYIHSFRPFAYPSSPNLALLVPRHQQDLQRPPPPLCKYHEYQGNIVI